MTKELKNLILSLLIGVLIIAGAVKIIWHDTDLDLSKTRQLTGEVTSASTVTEKVGSGKYSQYKQFFHFRLHNSSLLFSVYRSHEGYIDLVQQVEVGDSVKVYYKPSNDRHNVYQLEKGSKVLFDYYTYNKQANTAAGWLLLIGCALIVYIVILYTKFNIWRFLLRLVS